MCGGYVKENLKSTRMKYTKDAQKILKARFEQKPHIFLLLMMSENLNEKQHNKIYVAARTNLAQHNEKD